jgi:hypothetical protein
MLVLLDVAAGGCHHHLDWLPRLYSNISKQMHTALSNCRLHCLIHQPAVWAYRKVGSYVSNIPQPASFVLKQHFTFL